MFEATVRAYALGNLDAAAAYFADDAIFAVYVDQDVLPFGGEVHDRQSMLGCWREVRRHFELKTYALRTILAHDIIVHAQIDYLFHHRASGEEIDGTMRVVAEVMGGRITSFREYHDQERIRAFMRLCEQKSAE